MALNTDDFNERVIQRLEDKARACYLTVNETPEIPEDIDFQVYASIALMGGEAYLDDIASMIKIDGYTLKEKVIDDLHGLEHMDNIYRLKKDFFEKNKAEIESSMRKAMGYKQKPMRKEVDKIGLEALFDPGKPDEDIDLWTNYKG